MAAPTLQLDGDFESGTLDGWQFSGSHNVEVATSPVRSGKYAAHMHLDASSETLYRDELTTGDGNILYDKEYWIGFSFNVVTWDEPHPTWSSLFQLHAVPGNENWDCVASRNPVSISLDDGKLGLNVITEKKTVAASGGALAKSVWTTPLEMNEWQDFVVHLIPSLSDDGLIEVFHDGVSIYEQHGPSVDELDSCGVPSDPRVYLKIGIYKDKTNTETQDLYYDDVRIFQGADGYDLVAPPVGPEPVPGPDSGAPTGGSGGLPSPVEDAGTPPASTGGNASGGASAQPDAPTPEATDDSNCALVAGGASNASSFFALTALALAGFLSRRRALCVADGSAFGARSRAHRRGR